MFENMEQLSEIFNNLHRQLGKYFFGPPEISQLVTIGLLSSGHILLEGVPGVAKTTLVRFYSSLTGCRSGRIQFTPDLMPSDITGTIIPSADFSEQKFIQGPIFTQILLADEINRAPAKTQSALLEALEEKAVTIQNNNYKMSDPFFVLATQNPEESAGTFPLPDATVDRFLLRIKLGYPAKVEELEMMKAHHIIPDMPEPLLNSQAIVLAQKAVEKVNLSDSLMRYVLAIVRWTRNHQQIKLGASPRSGLAFLRAIKAKAALEGRDYGIPDDAKFLASSVLSHRLVLTYEAQMSGIKPENLITEALKELEILI
ncbi:MAG: AAA family ATPase [Myxococcota bacterium]